MPEETYIQALRNSLMTFRAVVTEFGKVEIEMWEARDRGDTQELQHLEAVWGKHADDRLGIALALVQTMNLLAQAGVRIPNPRWKTPPWSLREWHSILAAGID